MLEFKSITGYRPGIILSLLDRSYASLIESESCATDSWQSDWQAFDELAFAHPDTVGRCVFVLTLDGEPIGFASYDPRKAPDVGIIGHNCIVPEYQGRGFGKKQVVEVIRRFKIRGIKRALVSTCDHPFFVPAQRQYLANGFVERRRYPNQKMLGRNTIEYDELI